MNELVKKTNLDLDGYRYELVVHNSHWDTLYITKIDEWADGDSCNYWIGPDDEFIKIHDEDVIPSEISSILEYLKIYMRTGLYKSMELKLYMEQFKNG